jgi:4-hydroxy-tetrahydrodipicolinate synthase
VNGAAGLFSGSGNVAPAQMRRLWDLVKSKDYIQAEKVWRPLQPISRLLWTLPFNPVAKAGSDMTGRKVGPCRRPVPPLKANEMKMVEAAVAALSA